MLEKHGMTQDEYDARSHEAFRKHKLKEKKEGEKAKERERKRVSE